jgi:hypothetical protein
MLTRKALHKKIERHWNSGRVLRAWMGQEPGLFPLRVSAGKPTAKTLVDDFSQVREWKMDLEQGSAADGYSIVYREINHRQLGHQSLPGQLVFNTPARVAAYLGKSHAFERFKQLHDVIIEQQPALQNWLHAQPMKVLEQAQHWGALLAVIAFFQAHPRPNRYLRELLIPTVDTKFIEARKGLIAQLLDHTLPPEVIDPQVVGLARHGFERRYGLKYDQPLIRFRLLDNVQGRTNIAGARDGGSDAEQGRTNIAGARDGGSDAEHGRTNITGAMDDISLPLEQFQRLDPPVTRVFITENKINGLSFPRLPGSMVIFGLGYGISGLKSIGWLQRCEIHYWGDIDTHGFAMLSQLRGYYHHTRSLLMDRDTLDSFPQAWVEEQGKRIVTELENLNAVEQACYRLLCEDRLGKHIRLEQERVPFDRLMAALSKV